MNCLGNTGRPKQDNKILMSWLCFATPFNVRFAKEMRIAAPFSQGMSAAAVGWFLLGDGKLFCRGGVDDSRKDTSSFCARKFP